MKLIQGLLMILLLTTLIPVLGWQLMQSEPVDIEQLITKQELNAKQRLDSLYNNIVEIRQLEHWQLEQIRVIKTNALFSLTNRGHGRVKLLQSWAEQQGFLLNIDHNGITLLSGTRYIPVLSKGILFNLTSASGYLIDSIQYALQDIHIQFAEDQQQVYFNQPTYKIRQLTLNLEEHSYSDLIDLGTIMDGMPLSFIDATLELSETGGIKGQLTFNLYGV